MSGKEIDDLLFRLARPNEFQRYTYVFYTGTLKSARLQHINGKR
jgi:hypothetical protein